jgi:hypothetical protein
MNFILETLRLHQVNSMMYGIFVILFIYLWLQINYTGNQNRLENNDPKLSGRSLSSARSSVKQTFDDSEKHSYYNSNKRYSSKPLQKIDSSIVENIQASKSN